jgi:hypothetical protein
VGVVEAEAARRRVGVAVVGELAAGDGAGARVHDLAVFDRLGEARVGRDEDARLDELERARSLG